MLIINSFLLWCLSFLSWGISANCFVPPLPAPARLSSGAIPTTTSFPNGAILRVLATRTGNDHGKKQDPKVITGARKRKPKPSGIKTIAKATSIPKEFRRWQESYALLLEYYEEHGHPNVPRYYKEDPKLGKWLEAQRRRRHSISSDKRAKLDALSITWDGVDKEKFDQRWENMFQCLEEYKEVEGDCCVPKNYEPDQKLANWVSTQRRHNTLGKIKPDRFERLDSIGFVWRLKEFQNRESALWEERWEKQFEELLQYRKENGHCRVPLLFKENQKLAKWVRKQRQLLVYGELRQDREKMLQEIDFTWDFEDIYDETWQSKYNQLIELKDNKQQKAGDGRRTWANRTNQLELFRWEIFQQDFYKRGTLTPQRASMLAEIGYWDSFGLAAGESRS